MKPYYDDGTPEQWKTPDVIWDDVYRICMSTKTGAEWDDEHLRFVPVTHEGAKVLTGVITAYITEHFEPRSTA